MSLKSRLAAWYFAKQLRRALVEWIGRPLTKGESTMFKNWQTTLIGVVMGAAQMHQGGMTWGNAAIAALMAGLGFAAKDAGVTGVGSSASRGVRP